mmetsp:Transcript_8976/g.12736  ORF Transcript_8976/g.12736 Transcript_8976/m.12736 type:complete len:392 (+) Transcript_8976:94-1269(+)
MASFSFPRVLKKAFLVCSLLSMPEVEAFTNQNRFHIRHCLSSDVTSVTKSSVVLHKVPMQRGDPDADYVAPQVEANPEEEENAEPTPLAIPSSSLTELLRPPSSCNVNQMGPTAMAYIGDIVYELFVRSKYVWPPRKMPDLQGLVVGFVRAEYQSGLLDKLVEACLLSPKEEQVLMRGRNSKTQSRYRRNSPAYQDSTAFETVLGYLYITDVKRCQLLFNWIDAYLDGDDDRMNIPSSTTLDELLCPPIMSNVNQMSPADLAFIGDVLYEMFIRCRHVWPPRKTADMQVQVVSLVRAEHQSELLEKLMESFPLSTMELQALSRGRNAFKATSANQRASIREFQDASALKSLLGYLYVNDQYRCEDMLNWIDAYLMRLQQQQEEQEQINKEK